jgi:hypothetical protein
MSSARWCGWRRLICSCQTDVLLAGDNSGRDGCGGTSSNRPVLSLHLHFRQVEYDTVSTTDSFPASLVAAENFTPSFAPPPSAPSLNIHSKKTLQLCIRWERSDPSCGVNRCLACPACPARPCLVAGPPRSHQGQRRYSGGSSRSVPAVVCLRKRRCRRRKGKRTVVGWTTLAAAAALIRSHSRRTLAWPGLVSGPNIEPERRAAWPGSRSCMLCFGCWEGKGGRNETSGPLAVAAALPGPLTTRWADNVMWDGNPGSVGALFHVFAPAGKLDRTAIAPDRPTARRFLRLGRPSTPGHIIKFH